LTSGLTARKLVEKSVGNIAHKGGKVEFTIVNGLGMILFSTENINNVLTWLQAKDYNCLYNLRIVITKKLDTIKVIPDLVKLESQLNAAIERLK
jgi:hypothetical protein